MIIKQTDSKKKVKIVSSQWELKVKTCHWLQVIGRLGQIPPSLGNPEAFDYHPCLGGEKFKPCLGGLGHLSLKCHVFPI